MIRFFTEDTAYKLPQKQATRQWLKTQATQAGNVVGELNYIFCSDEYLLGVNREYLNHDYYTDIITFDNSEIDGRIDGDVFISVDRVADNARRLNVAPEREMRRVLAHGLLHLCGWGDKTDAEQRAMRQKEDEWLAAFPAT